jgi:hypothetical protein
MEPAAASSPYAAPTEAPIPDWLASNKGDIGLAEKLGMSEYAQERPLGEPNMQIIDAQVHADERNHPGRPWVDHLQGPPSATGDQMAAVTARLPVLGHLKAIKSF